MITKLKYILAFFIFLVISFFIINFPKAYFYLHDKKMLNSISKKSLNLENIYDNYNLTNDEKFEILFSGNYNNMQMLEVPTRENYEHNINSIKAELEKINPLLANIYEENFMFDYGYLQNFDISKNYLNSDDYHGLTLKNVIYSNDVFSVYVVMDAYDNTIFHLNITNAGTKYYPFDIKPLFENLENDFRKYLNVDQNVVYNVIANFDSCYEGCDVLFLSVHGKDIYSEVKYDKNEFDY
ncbi:MAG: hypothetical protein HFI86_00300 [Bacilli bacterium]|nr:hypothetical protein [Bacilli bacterium]